MTDENRPPLEESEEVAAAVEDDVAVDAFITGGGADADTPQFQPPGQEPITPAAPGQDEAESGTPGQEPAWRTGADQPWDPEDLAVAQGRDPTPENVERARQELDEDGPAAIERTVP